MSERCPSCQQALSKFHAGSFCSYCYAPLKGTGSKEPSIEQSASSASFNRDTGSSEYSQQRGHKRGTHSDSSQVKSSIPSNSYQSHIFFNFIAPFLNAIDNGSFFCKPMKILYGGMAILNALMPIYMLIGFMRQSIFRSTFKLIVIFGLVWLIVAIASWLSFQLWWIRKEQIEYFFFPGDEFMTTPIFSHFIQTFGEWLGIYLAVVGSLVSLMTTLFLGENAGLFSSYLGFNFFNVGLISTLLMPAYGYFIIITSRFIAEQSRALATIANQSRTQNMHLLNMVEEIKSQASNPVNEELKRVLSFIGNNSNIQNSYLRKIYEELSQQQSEQDNSQTS